MPGILPNVKNFLLNSDYPPEKVIFKFSATYSINVHPFHSDAQTFVIPHGLGFAPLCRGSYRFTNLSGSIDWMAIDTCVPLGDFFGTTTNWYNAILTAVYSDDTNVYFYVWNNTVIPATMDVRLVGFLDEATVPPAMGPTNTINNGFILNSDNNYLKIVNRGSGTINATAGTQTVVIPHGLGYIPLIFVWVYSPDTLMWSACGTENYRGVTDFNSSAIADNTNLTISITSYGLGLGGNSKYAYRIFADG